MKQNLKVKMTLNMKLMEYQCCMHYYKIKGLM